MSLRATLAALGARPTLPLALAVGGLLVVGLVARAVHLHDPVRSDEVATYFQYASRPFVDTVTLYDDPNNHPLNSIAMKLTMAVLGDGPARWRLPSLAAGMGVLALTALMARRWFGPAATAAALMVAAVSPPLTHYSALARGYTLMTFFGLLALYATDKRHAGEGGRGYGVLAAVGAALCCYAIPSGVMFVVPLAAYDAVMTFRRGRRHVLAWLAIWFGAAGLTALLYLPIVAVSGWRALLVNRYVTPTDAFAFHVDRWTKALKSAKSWGWGGPAVWGPLALAGMVAGVFTRRAFLALWLSLAAFVAFLVFRHYPVPTQPFVLFVPFIALNVGALAQAVARRIRAAPRAVAWGSAAGVTALAAALALAQEKDRLIIDAKRSGAAPGAGAAAAALAPLTPLPVVVPYRAYVLTTSYYLLKAGWPQELLPDGATPKALCYDAYAVVVAAGGDAGAPATLLRRWGGRVTRATLVAAGTDVDVWRVNVFNAAPP